MLNICEYKLTKGGTQLGDEIVSTGELCIYTHTERHLVKHVFVLQRIK